MQAIFGQASPVILRLIVRTTHAYLKIPYRERERYDLKAYLDELKHAYDPSS